MSDGDRFHRDNPKRTQPRRNMSGTLRNDDPWRTRPAPPGQFNEADDWSEESKEKSPNQGDRDGVDEAYRVAEENIRKGPWRGSARNQRGYDWRSSGYGPRYDSPFGYAGNGSPFGSGFGGRSSDGLLEQIMRTYMDMMGLVGTMMNGVGRAPYPQSYPRPFESRRDPEFRYNTDDAPHGRSAAIRIEVTSSQTNQIALDLRALPLHASLSVPPLRTLQGKAEIHDIRFETVNDRHVLQITIPDRHPPGVYSGVIAEARTGEPCGTLAVQVGQPTAPRAQARPTKTHR